MSESGSSQPRTTPRRSQRQPIGPASPTPTFEWVSLNGSATPFRETDADVVVVTPHWGPNMVAEPVAHVRAAAAELLDAGAALVAGHSAHVFHGAGHRVLYDLGDFIDDYARDPGLHNEFGLLWLVTIDEHVPTCVEAVPLALDHCYTRLADKDEAAWIANRLRRACSALGTEVHEVRGRLVVRWEYAGSAPASSRSAVPAASHRRSPIGMGAEMSRVHAIDETIAKTNHWLEEIERIGNYDDRHHAYAGLRAVLHALRDRLDIEVAAHLSAQLPMLVRGIFYEGWDPTHVPVRMTVDEFLDRVEKEGHFKGRSEAEDAARAVTTTLWSELTPGMVEHVMKLLPEEYRDIF